MPARPDWGLGNTAKDLMRNFTANLKTPEIASRVIARQQLDKNPYDLLANTQVEPDSSTFTIKVQVRDADGEVAKLAALGFADEFFEERTAYYAQSTRATALRSRSAAANIGYSQIQPKPTLNAVAGGCPRFVAGHRPGVVADLDGGGFVAHAGGHRTITGHACAWGNPAECRQS